MVVLASDGEAVEAVQSSENLTLRILPGRPLSCVLEDEVASNEGMLIWTKRRLCDCTSKSNKPLVTMLVTSPIYI